MSWKAKYNEKQENKTARRSGPSDQDLHFEELRRKYALAITYLLANNVKQSDLRSYLRDDSKNSRRYESIKKFRQQIIDARPKARQWVDKGFYVGIRIGDTTLLDDGSIQTKLIIGNSVIKNVTSVVSSRGELDAYMETIAKIIDSDKIWNDPDMADFDIGERDDLATPATKRLKTSATTSKVIPVEQSNEEKQTATCSNPNEAKDAEPLPPKPEETQEADDNNQDKNGSDLVCTEEKGSLNLESCDEPTELIDTSIKEVVAETQRIPTPIPDKGRVTRSMLHSKRLIDFRE